MRSKATILFLMTLAGGTSAAPLAAAGAGSVKCEITENGKPAFGEIALFEGDKKVASGECGSKAVSVPVGSYVAVLSLDGALDAPEQRQEITVKAGSTQSASADFVTGTLSVQIKREGRSAAGMAIVRRAGEQVGTLGSGVAARLSAGTYDIVVRYRTQTLDFKDVVVAAGQQRTLDATFE